MNKSIWYYVYSNAEIPIIETKKTSVNMYKRGYSKTKLSAWKKFREESLLEIAHNHKSLVNRVNLSLASHTRFDLAEEEIARLGKKL